MGSGWLDAPRGAVEERVVRVHGEEVVQHRIDRPIGSAKVQIFDSHTGRVVDQQEQSNFISKLWAFSARGWQRYGWSTYPVNTLTDIEGIPVAGESGRIPFQFPNNSIAAWNSSAAEDPMTENRVNTDSQGLVAFATRSPIGSPTGKRGVLNVSESYWGINVEHQVYDWPTSTGNGTFRSVGYTNVYPDQYGRLYLRPSVADRRWLYSSGDLRTTIYGGSASTLYMGASKLDANGDLVIPVRLNGVSDAFAIAKVAASDLVYAGLVQNGLGAAERSVTLSVPFNNSSAMHTISSSAANTMICFLGEHGGYYWFTGPGSLTTSHLVRVHKSTGVGDRQVTNSNFNIGGGLAGGSTNAQGCIIGDNAFIFGAGSNPAIYRYDLTANPPTLTATIAPSYPALASAFPSSVTHCCTDGTDIYCYHNQAGMLKFNTSGGLVSELGMVTDSSVSESGSAPYPGTNWLLGGSLYEHFSSSRGRGGGSGSPSFSTGTLSLNYRGRNWLNFSIMWFEGDLHICPYGLVGSPDSLVVGLMQAGWNLGSRSLLSGDVTKTSSNTMKITYTITLPDIV